MTVELVARGQSAALFSGSADSAFVFGFETFIVAFFEVFGYGVGVVGGDVGGIVWWAVV